MFVKWDITARCNLKCSHCSAVETYGEMTPVLKEPELTLDEVKRIIDDLAAAGVTAIHFLGGEPFIRKDFFDILEHCAARGIRIGINTNGTYLTRERVQRLARLGEAIADITFSLDGGDAETNDLVRSTGSFVGVIQGLRNALDSPLGDLPHHPINTNTVITKPLIRTLDRLLDLFDSMPKLRRMTFTRLEVEGGAREAAVLEALAVTDQVELLDLYERIAAWAAQRPHLEVTIPAPPRVLRYLNERFGSRFPIREDTCPAGSVLSYIDARGRMYPCNRWTVINFIEENGIARWEDNDLRTRDFRSIYTSDAWHQFFRFAHNPALHAQRYPCTACEFFDTCYSCPVSVAAAGVSVARMCMVAEERRAQYVASACAD